MTSPIGSDSLTNIKDILIEMTQGKACQFHPNYCEQAKDAPCSKWDTSHHVSVIQADGKRKRVAEFTHAIDAAFYERARDIIPFLLTEHDRLTEEVSRLEADLDAHKKSVTGRETADNQVPSMWVLKQAVDGIQLVRKMMNTHINGGGGWMADFERLVEPLIHMSSKKVCASCDDTRKVSKRVDDWLVSHFEDVPCGKCSTEITQGCAASHGRLEWSHIDTAPRDGTWFAARTAAGRYVRIVRYADKYDRYPTDESNKCWETPPAEWSPIGALVSSIQPVAPAMQNATHAPVTEALSANGELLGTPLEMTMRSVVRKVTKHHGMSSDGVVEADIVRGILAAIRAIIV